MLNPIVNTIPDGKIQDYIDGKFRNDTPEEYVRQTIEKRLVDEHRYNPKQIAVEYTLQVGSRKPRADLVVWDRNVVDKSQNTVKIIIECKRETVDARSEKDGIAQLQSYMSVCPNCEWGMWTNSIQKFVFKRITSADGQIIFEDYIDIPSAEGSIEDIDRPTRKTLKNASDDNLLFVFRTCHNHIYANDGLQKQPAFFELLKIIFCKIEDERRISYPLEFFTTSKERSNPDGQLTVYNRISKIFERVKAHYGKIFEPNDQLKLQPRSLAHIVGELQKYSLLNTDIDIKGKAYEEIVGANLRGDRGEFFTPRNVMKMVVGMIDPQLGERVLDSSCGTGGFLVTAMTHAIEQIENNFRAEFGDKSDWSDRIKQEFNRQIAEEASTNYFGFDLNPDLVKATKMNMVMNNDGSGNILQTNSLLPPHEWSEEFRRQLANALKIDQSTLRTHHSIALFDVIVTNPPFGSKIPIKDDNILRQFELAHIWKFNRALECWEMTSQLQSSVPPEILFIERCTQLLKNGGRLGIVLPDSILGSPGLEYIRQWIIRNHRIIASVDLHADTFQPRNGTQTSVLILQKKSVDTNEDYEVFMTPVEHIGHDKRGNPTYKRDPDGNEILDGKNKISDDQTPEVVRAFLAWKKKLSARNFQVNWCTVRLSEIIERGRRLEAGVYDVEALNARRIVFNVKHIAFKDIADAHYPPRFKRIYCEKLNGVPLYLPSQITDLKPNPEKFISMATKYNLKELRLKKNTVLLTRSGTIGDVGYVSRTFDEKIFSDDVIRIKTVGEFDAGYLYAYLKSTVGNKLLTASSYGAVITHIEPEHLSDLPVPDAPLDIKRRIHELIVRSYELRDESNELIDAAERLLIDELHLPPIEDFKSESMSFSVKLSDIWSSRRLDASYHAPIVGRIVDHLKKYAEEVTTVGDGRISKKIILAGIFKRVYVHKEFGYPFLGGNDITKLIPTTEKFLSKAIHKIRYEKELKVTENMILVTDRGTIGNVAMVPRHWNGFAVSQNVLKIVPMNKNIAGYLFIYLNMDVGKTLIRRETYGSVVDMIDEKSLATVPIPLLRDQTVQNRINTLALEANAKRTEAYCLERKALSIMNSEVLSLD